MLLPNDIHGSYSSLEMALEEKFDPFSKQEDYKAEFKWQQQKKKTDS